MPDDRRRNAKLIWYGVLVLLLLALPQLVGQRLSEVVGTVGLYVLLGLGLNIVVGFAGLLDLGYVAFYAVGAYIDRAPDLARLAGLQPGAAVLGARCRS